MAASSFGWLDYDEGDRRRMAEVVNLFREQGTLDELGIGPVRDTFADLFFPGTSTIQTRARYFLFVPWLFTRLEQERVAPDRAEWRVRELHGRLVQSLIAGGEGANAGLIGIEAGEHIQRLPSSIYWQGLRRWGIRLYPRSAERLATSFGGQAVGERAARTSEGGELIDAARRHWHASLPPAPDEFLTQTSFALTALEAEFLAERIRHACGDSLLAACLAMKPTPLNRARAPWELNGLASLPTMLQAAIEDARCYALAMEGAVLLYNHMLAELADARRPDSDRDKVEHYSRELDRWGDEMEANAATLQAWRLPEFWARLRNENPRLPPSAERFSHAWIALAIAGQRSVSVSDAARMLIETREYRLKGNRARLRNPRALERWSGESGVGRLTYRWGNAKRLLLDIIDGPRQPASTG